jgi:hypothetical protein
MNEQKPGVSLGRRRREGDGRAKETPREIHLSLAESVQPSSDQVARSIGIIGVRR